VIRIIRTQAPSFIFFFHYIISILKKIKIYITYV
jgi:hypothetical protein